MFKFVKKLSKSVGKLFRSQKSSNFSYEVVSNKPTNFEKRDSTIAKRKSTINKKSLNSIENNLILATKRVQKHFKINSNQAELLVNMSLGNKQSLSAKDNQLKKLINPEYNLNNITKNKFIAEEFRSRGIGKMSISDKLNIVESENFYQNYQEEINKIWEARDTNQIGNLKARNMLSDIVSRKSIKSQINRIKTELKI